MKATIFLLLFSCLNLLGQGQFKNWYFGTNAGLSFASGSPAALTNGALVTTEGCASISDASGNLLFYTDGVTVWNRNHVVMTNGSGLLGDASSTQSAIIVQQPLSSNLFYVFTADNDAGPNGICYSIVDLSLSSGLGAVTSKNVLLYNPSCEKLCAVIHCNNQDVWVVSHDWNSNNFRCWLITDLGINTTPIVSSSGIIPNGITQSSYGQLKSNSAGNKLLACYYGFSGSGTNRMQLYDFNNLTGIVSNAITLASDNGLYGCEFSPSGNMVYGSTNGGLLLQFNICLNNASAIISSRNVISNAGPFIGSLQLGPDQKIYVSRNNTALAVINNPNLYGPACNYVNAAVPLSGRASRMGLPNFASYYNRARDDCTYNVNCLVATFNAITQSNLPCQANDVVLIEWNFGDGQYAVGDQVIHQYNGAGSYNVLLTVTHNCYVENVSKTVTTTAGSTLILTNITQP
jgi:hypothetical protein